MNTTETYWEVDGVSLQTYAWNITTGGRDRTPSIPLRGDNLVVPYAPGAVFMKKIPDSRSLTLRMWVQGSNANGTIPTEHYTRQLYEKNVRDLRRLLWSPRKELTLTKRFWVPIAELTAGGVNIAPLTKVGTYALYSASAKAQFTGGFDPTMQGGSHATFEVDLTLADPYFYSDELTVSLAVGNRNLTILGDDRTLDVSLEFVGPRAGITLRNNTIPTEFRYTGTIASGSTLTVKVKDFSANLVTGSTTANSVGYVKHNGDSFWLPLEAGTNALIYSATSGSGATTLKYRPVWI